MLFVSEAPSHGDTMQLNEWVCLQWHLGTPPGGGRGESQRLRTNLEPASSRKAAGREANIEVAVTVRVVGLSWGLALFSTDKQDAFHFLLSCAGLTHDIQVQSVIFLTETQIYKYNVQACTHAIRYSFLLTHRDKFTPLDNTYTQH